MQYITPGYEGMELSTQILIGEALKQGIIVDILDREDNFISLTKSGKTEYVKQATRTSADTYITPLIMGNKQATKKILAANGIHVPEGKVYSQVNDAMDDIEFHFDKSIVIKPKSTNFGVGVSILKQMSSKNKFKEALLAAFSYDSSVIVERFIPGKEYRFLIIGGEVVAVLHRIPANVTGDGTHSIEELVAQKNNDPIRSIGYKTPLEKIQTGKDEIDFLSEQGLTLSTIPTKDQQVFLRKNSNISTGGDSIDYTDNVHNSYKKIAVNAAESVGANICGADIIIHDLEEKPGEDRYGNVNYGVIELNYNPALHIHEFPYKGKKRFTEKKILALLGF